MNKSHRTAPLHWPGAERWKPSKLLVLTNKVLGKLRSPFELRRRFDHQEDMVSVEQVGNFEILITMLMEQRVPGDLVELGCYTGGSAAVIAGLVQRLDPTRNFHVFDRFDIELGTQRNIEQVFQENMRRCNVPMPVVHKGDLLDTIPAQLPPHIAFAHVDCGWGGGVDAHAAVVTHCLEALYPRMQAGGIIVLMDYHIPDHTRGGNDSNPGMRKAADTFFADRQESIQLLHGGPCSHAFVRKG